jgi:hypothetical protein
MTGRPLKAAFPLWYILNLFSRTLLYFSSTCMKRVFTIFVFIFFSLALAGQIVFKTVVPQLPIISGESFQVQYIIENGDKSMTVKPPAFNNFRFVTGPNIYTGNVSTIYGMKPLKNSVYTLEAGKPGKFILPGATIIVNGKLVRSNDVMVEVVSREEALKRFNKENGIGNSDYFLRPGEDVYDKIRQNLFVKVMVNRKDCYVGEPVLATFKLYSRLESKSDIVKNPGFYGFTVYDMVNLEDKQVAIENINGKTFNVHTVRKVQLYPLQAGLFTVDPMEIKNKVEFSRSVVNKRTEQEVIEGVLGNPDNPSPAEGTETFETDIRTEPLAIRVKPVAEKNMVPGFNGATGQFTISAMVVKEQLQKNEEGFLEITISGRGNFIQLSAPVIRWPAGMEGFEPEVKDVFDKTKTPLAGSRMFRYPFVCSSPADYMIPAIQFTFFNPDSGSYKTVSTPPVRVLISNEEKITATVKGKTIKKTGSPMIYWVAGLSIVLLSLAGMLWLRRKKRSEASTATITPVSLLSARELLLPAYGALHDNDRNFYTSLQQSVLEFFNRYFDLSGSGMKKEMLMAELRARGINDKWIEKLQSLLQECETGMFTRANLGTDKEKLLREAAAIMETIGQLLV